MMGLVAEFGSWFKQDFGWLVVEPKRAPSFSKPEPSRSGGSSLVPRDPTPATQLSPVINRMVARSIAGGRGS